MKLISCHIENYGKIRNEDIVFDDKLTVFCEGNGYGKTTLASFLKAMLYGLDSDRANSKDFGDRRRFCPFDGGKFGGSLTFSARGSIYRVERDFDERSEVKDTVVIYRNNVRYTPSARTLGEELFGIDRESFERTVFISSKEIEISSTGSINTKLNNFVQGGTDDVNLETALAKLESVSKNYKKSRAGSNHLIGRETQHVLALQEKIANLEQIKAGLPEKYRRLKEAEGEVAALSKAISEAQNTNVVLRDWERYDAVLQDVNSVKGRIRELESKYVCGFPSNEELSAVREAVETERELNAKSQQRLFTDEDGVKLRGLQAQFSGGVPTEEQLTAASREIQALHTDASELELLSRASISEQEGRLRQKFAYHVPNERELSEIDALAEKCRSAEREYRSLPDFSVSSASQEPIQRPKSGPIYLILAVVAILLLVGGLAAVFFHTVVGVILLVLGGAGLLVDGFLYLNRKTNLQTQGNVIRTENAEKRRMGQDLDALYGRMQAILAPYGYSLENGVPYAVKSLKEDLNALHSLNRRLEEERQARTALTGRQRERTAWIEAFFAQYKIVGEDFVGQLSRLRTDIAQYNSLLQRRNKALTEEHALQEAFGANRRVIFDFCEKYGVDIRYAADFIKQMETDRRDLETARGAYAEQMRRAEVLKAEKGLAERPNTEASDLEEMNRLRDEAQDRKNALAKAVTDDEAEIERLDDIKNERAAAEDRLNEYRYRYELLQRTMESLTRADRRLKDKYVKPIRDRFVHYSAPLEQALGEKIVMDPNFEIRFERGGRERSEKHLSTGQRSICALCFRLALIDNMYGGEKPFLILDDPFVSLDGEHLEKVKALLEKLSLEMQMVYFTCHESRTLS